MQRVSTKWRSRYVGAFVFCANLPWFFTHPSLFFLSLSLSLSLSLCSRGERIERKQCFAHWASSDLRKPSGQNVFFPPPPPHPPNPPPTAVYYQYTLYRMKLSAPPPPPPLSLSLSASHVVSPFHSFFLISIKPSIPSHSHFPFLPPFCVPPGPTLPAHDRLVRCQGNAASIDNCAWQPTACWGLVFGTSDRASDSLSPSPVWCQLSMEVVNVTQKDVVFVSELDQTHPDCFPLICNFQLYDGYYPTHSKCQNCNLPTHMLKFCVHWLKNFLLSLSLSLSLFPITLPLQS